MARMCSCAVSGGFRDYVKVENDVALYDRESLEDLSWFVNRCLNDGISVDELCSVLYVVAKTYRYNDVGDVVKNPKTLFENALELINKYSQASDFDEFDCFKDVMDNVDV